jgi:TRAP transporter TAXI family solute receptor
MFKKRGMIFNLLGLALFLSLSVNASGQVRKFDIRWGTAPVGGTWAVLGNAMLEDILKVSPNLSGSSVPMGGAANVMGVHQGKLNIAFTFSDTMGDAWEGKEDFKDVGKVQNVRILASLFPEPTQFVVYADSGITSVPQLRGKKITPGPRASAIEIVTRRIFEAYGISTKDVQWRPLTFADAAEQMLDRHIDAICYGAMVYPAPPIVNVSSQRQIRLLPLSDEVIEKMVKSYRGIEPWTLPPGSYKGVDYPVKGISSECILVVREDMPEDVAYVITKSISENFDRYVQVVKAMAMGKSIKMGKDVGFPYHPGALKYYKEKGWVK